MKAKNDCIVYWLLLITLFCSAGSAFGQILTYTNETAYLNALVSAGYNSFKEGFEEDSVWGVTRFPGSAASVTSRGIIWTSNHPNTNPIRTGGGAAVTGSYGVYDPNHGFATGTVAQCDIDNPPAQCLFHDGVSGERVLGTAALVGVGGWFQGTHGADVAVVLNDTTQIGLGKLLNNQLYFFGVIDTDGFTAFEIRETDGKVGDELYIFADDFSFGTANTGNCQPISQTDTTCDGVDDDCNGLVDDGYVVNDSCGVGQCLANNIPSSCVGGGETLCTPGPSSPENSEPTCTDTIDNDCDGLVDAADPECGGGVATSFPWNLFLPAIIGTPTNSQ